jgi:hypothetical protein
MSIYERIKVIISGVSLTARPVGFISDKTGTPVTAVRWESTHPDTGELVEFGIEDVEFVDGVAYFGNKVSAPSKDKIVIRKPPVKRRVGERQSFRTVATPVVAQSKLSGCPFIDPVSTGLFKINS